MKKQEVLDYLGIEELPKATSISNKKCAALVKRTTGIEDYVICKNGGVIVDKKFKAGIAKIIEFYPEVKGKEEDVAEQTKPEQTKPEKSAVEQPKTETPVIEKPVVETPKPEKFVRSKAIAFLKEKGLNHKTLIKKKDIQLQELLKAY